MDGGHYGAVVARRTKRLWMNEEKRSICFQTTAPGVSVAQVARRYAVNANLIFKWLRDPRFAPEPLAGGCSPEGVQFLPVEIVQDPRELPAAPAAPAAGRLFIGTLVIYHIVAIAIALLHKPDLIIGTNAAEKKLRPLDWLGGTTVRSRR